MMYIMMSSIMSVMLSMILMSLCALVSTKTSKDREKSSPFECGFDPLKSPRMSMSIQFFLIAILFLIFDVEITIIIPMMITLKTSNMAWWAMTTMMFLITLITGLMYEWSSGALQWTT
uniref:NADH dehydrogenase subunit 3 n=1 Tax=Taiwanaptera montana TaxID=3135762 RepID=UPI0031F3F2BA